MEVIKTCIQNSCIWKNYNKKTIPVTHFANPSHCPKILYKSFPRSNYDYANTTPRCSPVFLQNFSKTPHCTRGSANAGNKASRLAANNRKN